MRGRTTSPHPGRAPSPGPPNPPSYARSHLDRSPSIDPIRPPNLVPPPIFLRSSSPSQISSKGTLKIHIPAWGIVIIKPPRRLDLHPLDTGPTGTTEQQPPAEDKVLTGAIEVMMKERRRVQAISVGVMSVCRLNMGRGRGWEEDGIFERGVEVLGGDAEGIWLEKGSQSFSFSILLPATLATHDHHQCARLSYMLTARVEGIPSKPLTSLFRPKDSSSQPYAEVQFKEDFDVVIARSTELAQDLALQRQNSLSSVSSGVGGFFSPTSSFNATSSSPAHGGSHGNEDGAIVFGESSPTLSGLYHRRQSTESIPRLPLVSLGSSPLANDKEDAGSIRSFGTASDFPRTEKNGWLKGDLVASRGLIIHANPSSSGGVTSLDLRKEGYVDGLGAWRFTASADVFTISAVILLSFNVPKPAPNCAIFFLRLLLTQSYSLTSPRTPNDRPFQPEQPKHHLLYQTGRAHKSGEKILQHNIPTLFRGPEAGGKDCAEGWKIRAVARLPAHEKIRPTTNEGTITPIRVSHELQLQVFYSIEGETVSGKPMVGPGELRMMLVKLPVIIPSCCCTRDALNLPTYESSEPKIPNSDIDKILNSPPNRPTCACGHTFAELGEAQMRRMQQADQEDQEMGLSSSSSRGGVVVDRDAERERQRWARREEKDQEARASSRGRYD